MRRIRPIRWTAALLFLGLIVAVPLVNRAMPGTALVMGSTWSLTLLGYKLSNPLAALEMTLASKTLHPELLLSVLIPLTLIALFGRFFCGWICPAGLLFELNSKLKRRIGTPDHRFSKAHKYGILGFALALAAFIGSTSIGMYHPPHVLARETFLLIEYGFLGTGALLFAAMLTAELTASERAVCRYLCPSGALLSLLGNLRRLRVGMEPGLCDRCGDCDEICMFDLKPMTLNSKRDVSPECNNCGDCIDVCHSDALHYRVETERVR